MVCDYVWSPKAHEVKSVFRCETHFHKWGRVQRLKPNDSHMTLGIALMWELWTFQALVGKAKNTKLGPQHTIEKVLKCICLKCPCIIHLDLICMNYDEKKGWELNWKFDSQSQIPWKQGSNEVWLERVIHHWKSIFKGYKIVPSHIKNKFDLRKIWASKVWDNKSPNLGLPLGNPEEKWHLDAIPMERHIIYYREGSGASSQRLWAMWSLCLKLSLLSPSHHFHSTCPFFLGCARWYHLELSLVSLS